MNRFSDKIALVSGGTTGIGAATARRFAAEGATVVVTGSQPETLARAKTELAGIEVVASDASDLDAIRTLVAKVAGDHGRIDVLGRTLATELVGRGIRVNTVSPGPVLTPMWGKISGLAGDELAEMQRGVASIVPLGRVGTSDEIAAAVAFLASSDASYVTGVDLPVDGGWLDLGRPMH